MRSFLPADREARAPRQAVVRISARPAPGVYGLQLAERGV
jgi:hypothetical protein